MHFSLLSLNLHTYQEADQDTKFDRIAELITQHNVTCLCLQECAQNRDAELLEPGGLVRADNAAQIIVEKLNRLGQKFDYVWDWAHYGFGSYEEGVAVVSQLPILVTNSTYISQSTDVEDADGARKAIHARLAMSTDMVIDVYSAHLSDPAAGGTDQAMALSRFVSSTPDLIREAAPPKPKRRGHMKLMSNEQIQPDPVRIIFVAGDFNDTPDGPTVAALTDAGFADPSSSIRDGGAATFEDGRWIDYVFMKPMLRPTAGLVAFDGTEQPRVSDHAGVVLAFEV